MLRPKKRSSPLAYVGLDELDCELTATEACDPGIGFRHTTACYRSIRIHFESIDLCTRRVPRLHRVLVFGFAAVVGYHVVPHFPPAPSYGIFRVRAVGNSAITKCRRPTVNHDQSYFFYSSTVFPNRGYAKTSPVDFLLGTRHPRPNPVIFVSSR